MQGTESLMEASYELDSTVLFKQDATELTTVQDLADCLSRFGFSPDDKLTRRELVTVYTRIRQAMEPEIFRLANSACYAEAKEMRARLTGIRNEFDHLQIKNNVENIQTEQRSLFQRASQEVLRNTSTKHEQELQQQSEMFQHLSQKHLLFHEIDQMKLEQKISKIPTPNMRYSKRLIELFKSEYNLNKLHQYDEAIKVRRMINKLLPKEEKSFYDRFHHSIEMQRKKQAEYHQEDDLRFEEKIKSIEWRELRRREKEMKISEQRISNHQLDMSHSHLMEGKLRPEMTVKPSALWQHRTGYEFTASSLRGQQLLDNARGKKIDKRVFADSLVVRHDYDQLPQDTIILRGRRGETMGAETGGVEGEESAFSY